MSSELYPIGLIQEIRSPRLDRVLKDEFEAGNTAARTLWPAKNFKRRLTVRHAPLTPDEYRYLRGFYAQHGTWDAFWFRDNANRAGNARVRFASPVDDALSKTVYVPEVTLEEIAPIRALPEMFEIINQTAGVVPFLWWDANRETYITHAGGLYREPQTYDAADRGHAALWRSGSSLNLGNAQSQWQHYAFTGSQWASTPGNVTALVGAQPAFSIFCLARHSPTATRQVLAAVGSVGSGQCLGIALSAANNYEPWIGGAESWGNSLTNAGGNAWRSFCAVWGAGSNSATFYVNAGSTGASSNARSFVPGPASLGASSAGTLILNPTGAMANANVAHVIMFAQALSPAHVYILHSLFAYQYGI